jgi:Arc/MetJ-type ribon-helix-helix transcriptional regulator
MAITTNKIDDFIQQQVVDGSCATATEAQQELICKLVERDLDQRIAKGREAAKEGRGRILNEESNREFLKKMEVKLLDN